MKIFALAARLALLAVLVFGAAPYARAQSNSPTAGLRWINGPGQVPLRNIARLTLPAGYDFLREEDTHTLLKALGSATDGNEVGFFAPASHQWFVVVRLLETGYLSDVGKTNLNPATLLQSLREVEAEANRNRQSGGQPPVIVQGWEISPAYDSATHSLEWAIRAVSRDKALITHSISVLGRHGAIQFLLVDQERKPSTLGVFKQLATGLQFNPGEAYADFHSGDRLAAAGLESLLPGGDRIKPPAPLQTNWFRSLVRSRILVVGLVVLFFLTIFGVAWALHLINRWHQLVRRARRHRTYVIPQPCVVDPRRRVDPHRYHQHVTRDIYRVTH